MKDIRLPQIPVITGTPLSGVKAAPQAPVVQGQSFRDLLGHAVEQRNPKHLTLSKHAWQRVADRGIELNDSDIERLAQAAQKADDKGITDSLVFMNNTAFIINIPNRVVVTVVDGMEDQESVFTNINGAVII